MEDEILKKLISECPNRPDEVSVYVDREDDMDVSYEITDISSMGSNDRIVITIKEV